MKKAILIQSPSFFFDVVPIFVKEAKKIGFFDKFYITTDYKGDINLGEECKIISINKDLNFSSNMIHALQYVEEDIFTICCEDHVLTDKNNLDRWNYYYKYFTSHSDMGFLRLSNTRRKVKPLDGYKDDDVFPISTKYRYYISLQFAFWRKSYFKFILEPNLDAYQFEWQGARKVRRAVRKDKINGLRSYCVRDCVAFRTNFYKDSQYYRGQYINYLFENNMKIDKSKKVRCKIGIITCDEYIDKFLKDKE